MTTVFEIIDVISIHDRGQFILAHCIDIGLDFEIKKGATLGDIPIDNYLEIPRLLDENAEPRMDVFVFKPLMPIRADKLVKGQLAELINIA